MDINILRHSTAHLLAHAVVELFPGTQLTIGPATEDGFFYDFVAPRSIKEEDLDHIQARMWELSQKNYPIEHKQISKDEARVIFKDNPFKLELINEIPEATVGITIQGDWIDLCRGGHVACTGDIKHFKLLNVSGSYWRGKRDGQALQRISGTAFFSREDLEEFDRIRQEAALYDHRKLGKQLDLFSFHEEGVGFPFYHPKGKAVINAMINYLRHEQDLAGYKEVQTPMMLSEGLWHRSGHWNFYKDNMFFCGMDHENYAVKPMNCPGAFLIYNERPRSYRELPLRVSEFGMVHRNELSGVLHGLLRVRAFTVDDAHIFITPDQIESEVLGIIALLKRVLTKYGLTNIKAFLATRPEKAMGSTAIWEKAEAALKAALDKVGMAYEVDAGGGAFYGPKIDFKFTDSLKREWQCGTVQLDFFQPENFDLTYVAPSGQKERPVIVHRALYGSVERFFAVLLEHYKGALPFWLAPEQVRILTITDDAIAYGQDILNQLKAMQVRAVLDQSSDQISAKIRTAQVEKVPMMLVLGKKEVEHNTISVRTLDGKQEMGVSVEAVKQKISALR